VDLFHSIVSMWSVTGLLVKWKSGGRRGELLTCECPAEDEVLRFLELARGLGFLDDKPGRVDVQGFGCGCCVELDAVLPGILV
jgi:hypothetical protein